MKAFKIILQIFMAVAIGVALSVAFGWNPFVCIASIAGLQILTRYIPMPAGLSFFNFSDLTWEGALENMGGFGSVAYFAAYEDIETWPTLMSSPTNDTQLVTLQGHFVMKADKHFIKVYVTPETADFKASNQGEVDGQSFRNEGEFFYPGSAVATRALARKLNNSRGVLILVDPDGERVCVGTEAFPAFFKPSLAFGKAAADRKGLTVTFYQNHFVPGLVYNGSIPLSGSLVPAIS